MKILDRDLNDFQREYVINNFKSKDNPWPLLFYGVVATVAAIIYWSNLLGYIESPGLNNIATLLFFIVSFGLFFAAIVNSVTVVGCWVLSRYIFSLNPEERKLGYNYFKDVMLQLERPTGIIVNILNYYFKFAVSVLILYFAYSGSLITAFIYIGCIFVTETATSIMHLETHKIVSNFTPEYIKILEPESVDN